MVSKRMYFSTPKHNDSQDDEIFVFYALRLTFSVKINPMLHLFAFTNSFNILHKVILNNKDKQSNSGCILNYL